jgi:hypothetical protein
VTNGKRSPPTSINTGSSAKQHEKRKYADPAPRKQGYCEEQKMIRNSNPFTPRQLRLLEAIQEKIFEINDPEAEIITNESYEWYAEQTKQFGKIPKIRFYPNSCLAKSEIIEKAEIIDEAKQQENKKLREKLIGIDTPRDKESRIQARLFESEWNNIMLKAKKATFTVGLINQLFCLTQQTISDPVEHLQRIVMDEYSPQIDSSKRNCYPKKKVSRLLEK